MNILLVGMRFCNYEQLIKEEYEKMGHKVTLVNDASERNTVYSRILSNNAKEHILKKYQQRTLYSIAVEEFDLVIVIVGRFLQRFFFETIKSKNPTAKFVLYLWDDVARVENFERVKKYYDEIFSFDPVDCSDYGFNFLPLFYTREFFLSKYKKKFSIYSALSNHSDRQRIVKSIVAQSRTKSDMLFYINMGRFEYAKHWFSNIFNKERCNECIHYVPSPISKEENIKLMKQSKALLDVQFSSQIGLTIRTIEALGSETKLITTNRSVQYYDFYNANNIYILERNNPIISLEFLEMEYKPVEPMIMNKYSITSWCKGILADTVETYTSCDITKIRQLLNNEGTKV